MEKCEMVQQNVPECEIDVQQSMHLHSFAPICTYATIKKHANKQKKHGEHI